ncbi:hypothetical protein BHE74_00041496 [Ensete ventricosum]|nr:hypothetical protein GW17_00024034 [Ensete ventricosum]RWW52109.1 hypothetical protein BHE74_00041496 [Ensete ventricosum]RZS16586.1 hypothetical protein BHM03_00048595 [Ensete ventricosum]
MSSALDMSLDDIIKNNKKSTPGGRGRGRGSGAGPARRVPNRPANRSAPYSVAKAPDSAWQHDKFAAQTGALPALAGRASSIETGTKLYISNLEYGVSNEDIKVMLVCFSDLILLLVDLNLDILSLDCQSFNMSFLNLLLNCSTGPGRGSAGPQGGGRGRGRGRGRGKGRGEPVSADALDADLDKYHAEAMQTN